MRLSLVIPCYNEAANLPLLLSRCAEVAHQGKIEIILVDNGSTDKSPRVLAELLPHHPGCRSVRVEKNQGYGFGLLSGLRAAEGKVLGWTHADMQTDPDDARRGLALFDQYGDTFLWGRRWAPADMLLLWADFRLHCWTAGGLSMPSDVFSRVLRTGTKRRTFSRSLPRTKAN